MDTVSMLNTMRFYCQPILPLVYDESMSYYETLCKVVGQLNTTGETVNKLNEGLTNEISDRQAADAALDERLKVIEAANEKIHFLVFDGANPNGGFPTRHELYQWVEAGDAIFALFRTNEEGRGQIYAASCSYNAGNWGSEASNDFNIIVPLETKYDGAYDYAVKQKVAKLTIPPISQTSLNVPWGLQIIEINTPYTSAEGVVNVIAVVSDSGSVNCSITPSEFLQLYNMTRGGKNLCVAVNAKLAYDGLARSSSIATVDTTNRIVRIAFERDFGTAITNGVNQLNKTLDYIIGDAKTGTWVHETIDYKIFDFIRYEGFQFTRVADNVITTDDESTPNAVYMQYRSNTSGKLYQNLPVRLIDTVDGAEYWNGTFDIYDDKHMTFTFVTSNYDTASDKMLVRVIKLSADVNTTAWKYGVKEFTLPRKDSDDVVTYAATNVGEGEYQAATHKTEYQVDFAEGVPAIIASIEAGKRVILRVDLKELDSELGATPLYFASGYTRVDLFPTAISYIFFGSISNGHYTLELNSGLAHATLTYYGEVLPEPNPDGTDNGKVPTINGKKWELKESSASDFMITATLASGGAATLDKTFAQIRDAITGGRAVFMQIVDPKGGPIIHASLINDTPTYLMFSAANRSAFYSVLNVVTVNSDDSCTVSRETMPVLDSNLALPQLSMASTPDEDMEIATKKYVDDHAAKDAVLYTAQTLTSWQKQRARNNIEALPVATPATGGVVSLCPDIGIADSNNAVHIVPSKVNDEDYTIALDCGPENWPVRVKGIRTPTDTDNNAAANVEYVKAKVAGATGATVDAEMSDTSTNAVQNKVIKKYVDDHATGGSPNAVLYTSQTLTAAQKKQARDNIDAASEFVITGTPDSSGGVTLDKTFAQIKEAINAGKRAIMKVAAGGGDYLVMSPIAVGADSFVFAQPTIEGDNLGGRTVTVVNNGATLSGALAPALATSGSMLQVRMASAPAENMQIATKQYVDDHSGGARVALSGTVEGEVTGYTSTTYQQIKDEIAKNGNIWLTINGETIRLGSWKQSGSAAYTLNFFGASVAGITTKYEVTASASSASLTVTG